MRVRMAILRATFIVCATVVTTPLFAFNAERDDVPLPRVKVRAEVRAEWVELDLRPLLEAVRRAYGSTRPITMSQFDGHTCVSIVTILYYGSPGTEIVYKERTYIIPPEGWIELVVNLRPTPTFLRWVKNTLRIPRGDAFWLVRGAQREQHPIRVLGARDDASAKLHDEQYYDSSGTMLILLMVETRTPVPVEQFAGGVP